ncbi:MAG: phosphohistidine phosphatase SixA [Aquincola sp.]|uniref:phosphohistidine phosphatase SixA n=1 Tax=uncultured Aquincola sp. TaxID=886556 RepID=UPI0032B1A9D3|nr:phosphohistidine phosphatase SixA [Aquincola sp.]
MDLILWRHADAVELHEPGDDLARPLTSKGERQAARVAAWLNQVLPESTRILASPARRTQQTAQALDRKFKTAPGLAPDGTVESLLAEARWPDSRHPVLVVGHQPTLGLAASYLLTRGTVQPWSIRKAGVWWLRLRERGGSSEVVLVSVRGPEHL